MAFEDSLFIGRTGAGTFSPKYNNITVIRGRTVSGENKIYDIVAFNATFDVNVLQIGQTLNIVQGSAFSSDVIIDGISGDTLTVNQTAIANVGVASSIYTADTPAGTYFFNSASFFDPQSNLTVNNITGSNDADYDSALSPIYGIIGQTTPSLNGSVIPAKFHLYKITNIIYRDPSSAEFSGFISWAEEGEESDSGEFLYTAQNQTLAVGALSTNSNNITIYDPATIGSNYGFISCNR